MNLDIKAANEDLQAEVKKYYSNHGTYHSGDAGLDLFLLQDCLVPPKEMGFRVPLGICAEAYYATRDFYNDKKGRLHAKVTRDPTSYYFYPRSSLGSRTPIRLANSVGIIDSGYRGELTAIVDNLADHPFVMRAGERYFQICGPKLEPITLTVVEKLSETSRGEGGFGSTGN